MSATLKQARHFLKVVDEKALSQEQVACLHDSGLFTDLLEAAKRGTLATVDRTIFRHILGLSPNANDKEPPQKRLRRLAEVTLSGRAEAFDPGVYYWNREGLWVGSSFEKYILAAAKSCASVPAATLTVYEILGPMNDNEIQAALPAEYVFEDANVFCAFLATMLDRQKNGAEGDLANGYANIFYVRGKEREVFAVRAAWSADYREWHVNAYRFDGLRWNAGVRVLSNNC